MSCKFIFIVALAFASFVSAARSVYTPGSFDNSKYSSSRSMSTDKWIIYWESGFGSDPTNASETYAVNMTRLKQVLDSCYDFNWYGGCCGESDGKRGSVRVHSQSPFRRKTPVRQQRKRIPCRN